MYRLLWLLCSALLSCDAAFKTWYSTALSRLSSIEPLTPISVDARYGGTPEGIKGSMVNNEVSLHSEAFESKSLAYLRMVSFSGGTGGGYNVFNLMALPRLSSSLPIFSADIVILPGGLLAAIDFQPARDVSSPDDDNERYFELPFYTEHKESMTAVASPLPSGGALPVEAQRFFSPQALWTRAAMKDVMAGLGGEEGGEQSVFDTGYMKGVEQAFYGYLDAYIHAIKTIHDDTSDKGGNGNGNTGSNKAAGELLKLPCETFLSEYLQYRIDKDPARNMLVGSFGEEWTESMLRDVLFPASVL